MDLTQIIERNYAATCRRGLISENTTFKDFIEKLREEVTELSNEKFTDNMTVEMADVALVIFAMAEHYNINLIAEMERKTLYNEKRSD